MCWLFLILFNHLQFLFIKVKDLWQAKQKCKTQVSEIFLFGQEEDRPATFTFFRPRRRPRTCRRCCCHRRGPPSPISMANHTTGDTRPFTLVQRTICLLLKCASFVLTLPLGAWFHTHGKKTPPLFGMDFGASTHFLDSQLQDSHLTSYSHDSFVAWFLFSLLGAGQFQSILWIVSCSFLGSTRVKIAFRPSEKHSVGQNLDFMCSYHGHDLQHTICAFLKTHS